MDHLTMRHSLNSRNAEVLNGKRAGYLPEAVGSERPHLDGTVKQK